MRKLELGVEYFTGEGIEVTVRSFHSFSETDHQAMCSDGWWRYSAGEHVGRFVSEEHHPRFRHHIDWEKFDASRIQEPEQLELF